MYFETAQYIRKHYDVIYKAGGIKSKKASVNSGLDRWGWYLQIKEVAEAGVFNQAGMTPIEAAGRANLYDFMNYIAAKRAEDEFRRLYSE